MTTITSADAVEQILKKIDVLNTNNLKVVTTRENGLFTIDITRSRHIKKTLAVVNECTTVSREELEACGWKLHYRNDEYSEYISTHVEEELLDRLVMYTSSDFFEELEELAKLYKAYCSIHGVEESTRISHDFFIALTILSLGFSKAVK